MNRSFDMKTVFPGRVSIIGAARSGIATARYFIDKKVTVFISDACGSEALALILERNGIAGIDYEYGGHSEKVLEADLIIISPGVPSDLSIVNMAREAGIPVWSEMELGYRASDARFFAVTGSTGKSTTVSLTGSVMEAGRIEYCVAGNIGVPVVAQTPAVSEKGVAVVEVSSFQLENIDRFHPAAAAVLNLVKNHLDRYPSEEAYYAAKMEIARNMSHSDCLILNALDKRLVVWGDELRRSVRVVYFGADMQGFDSFWFDGTLLQYRFDGATGSVGDCSGMKIIGKHNLQNGAVAAIFGKLAGVKDADILRGLCAFGGLPHRLEFVAESDGVRWYNDSKSTTAESIMCAVESFASGVILISGGKDKGCDFSTVRDMLSGRARMIILIGEAAGRIESQWRGVAPISRAATLEEAAAVAGAAAVTGDSVVFSPGCSSFDMFKNYEDRGNRFRAIVASYLKQGCGIVE